MSKLNRDLLYLIFENLKDDKKSYCSCLLINKTWCEIIVPILWKDPWSNLVYYSGEKQEILLLKVIISHIVNETKIKEIYDYLKNNQIDIDTSYQRPLFNYINFCKHLNFDSIMKITKIIDDSSERLFIKYEIFKLFINKNVKITHLYIPKQFSYQIYLIPDFKICFEKLEFLSYYNNIDNNILTGFIEVCKSIKELKLYFEQFENNYEISRLIETQKKLVNIHFRFCYGCCFSQNEPFCNTLENSLIKHANSIQYFTRFRPFTTEILSSLVNLKELNLHGNCSTQQSKWNYLEILSLPHLQFLEVNRIPIKYIINLIGSTKGSLIEIKIYDYIYTDNEEESEKIIQVIYKNCPKLKYLTLLIKEDTNILEIEKLLINCKNLNGLQFVLKDEFDWDNLFKVLSKSSPISLFKFIFNNYGPIKLESLKLFLDNWKGVRPMLLQLYLMDTGIRNLLEKYVSEGIVVHFNGW